MDTETTFDKIAADQRIMITEMNSKGIQLLTQNEFGNGAEIFLEALTLLLSETKEYKQSPPTLYTHIDVLAQDNTVAENKFLAFSQNTEDSYTRQLHGATARRRRAIYSVAIPNRNKHVSTLSNDVYQFFDRAIAVDKRGFRGTHENNLLTIGVLAYNVGLAYHLGGVFLCKSSLFTSALEYYNIAFTILDGMLSNQSKANGRGSLTKLPLLATLNNIGHIHAYQCSYSFAEEYCEEIAYHLESAGGARGKIFGSEEETEIFIQNACFYPRSEEISAASA